ncbi:hypothetical protein BJ508DRAFT_302779 [Ascobolus immersus RN42]|uniref:Uncharacterized protein n=1 Tax=Ascobolus immersus RN42 TaxID=1160509 RepID=A0A3N4IH95_ASCIM|nr:hypothetical protein BJ508DRAFT_302779 [Ascobolus immersus RN42]
MYHQSFLGLCFLALSVLQSTLASPAAPALINKISGNDHKVVGIFEQPHSCNVTACIEKADSDGGKVACGSHEHCVGGGLKLKAKNKVKSKAFTRFRTRVPIEPSSTDTSTSDPTSTCDPRAGNIICIDYLSECGIRYGGCVPLNCDGSVPSISKPPCPSTAESSPAASSPATFTASSTRLATLTATSATSTCNSRAGQSICVDSINECGRTYGGCGTINCDGSFPSFTKPPCTATSTRLVTTTVATITASTITATNGGTSTCAAGAGFTVCVDNINECGIWYGGCG